MNTLQKNYIWIHFIGIGGITMAPFANALSEKGYIITGSDIALFDPVKSFVLNTTLKVFYNYSYKNLIDGNYIPAIVVMGSGISLKNKEYLFAKKNNIRVVHYPKLLNTLVVAENSIVVAGTYGKTTISAMLTQIFDKSQISFMFGGIMKDMSESIRLKNSETLMSIVEGDEYISARFDQSSKFFYYDPKFLILNSAEWDHTDIFETEADYIQNFKTLVSNMPVNARIFANEDDSNVLKVLKGAKCDVSYFNKKMLLNWLKVNNIQLKILGEYNYLNAAVAGIFAQKHGVDIKQIKSSLEHFQGLRRRLEVRFPEKYSSKRQYRSVIIDDFASSPAKVKGTLDTLKQEFPNTKIISIFEPNTGNRTKQALENFRHAFMDADHVLLPVFSKLMKSTKYIIEEKKLASFLKTDGTKVYTPSDDKELINYCMNLRRKYKRIVFVFMSSHGMEDRINALILKL